MGTRASFWIGDPRDEKNREWLGCIAFDGHPSSFPELETCMYLESFRRIVREIGADDDYGFASPEKGGWPFPWKDDIFLTDYTYAFFDGEVHVTCFHHGFRKYSFFAKKKKDRGEDNYFDGNELSHNVSSNLDWDRSQPDSIIIINMQKR